MSTITTHDLMLALLAMDSYNRGSSAQTPLQFAEKSGGTLIEFAKQIGDATFKAASDSITDPNGLLTGSTNAGFSASYYTWNNETVIAYRGNDFGTQSFSSTFQDIIAGWSTSFNLVKPDTVVTVTVHLIKRANKYEIQIVVRFVILC